MIQLTCLVNTSQGFMKEMKRPDLPGALKGKVFGNIQAIHEFHSTYVMSCLHKRSKISALC